MTINWRSHVGACAEWLSDERHARQVAWIVFGLALIVRLTALGLLPNTALSVNARNSIIAGASLIRQGQFLANPDYPMLVPPLPALFMAGIQSIFDDGLMTVKVVQVILDAVLVAVVFAIGRAAVSYAAAVFGALALTVYPIAVAAPIFIGTEALFTLLLALFVLHAVKALQRQTLPWFAAAGLFLGFATLTRGTTQFFPLFFFAFLAWRQRRHLRARIVGQAACFMIGMAVVVGPWAARNLIVLDAFIPASISGQPLLHGSREDFWLIRDRERNVPPYYEYLRKEKGITVSEQASWPEKERFYRRAAIEVYRERWQKAPLSFVPYYAKKFARLWYGTESGRNEWTMLAINLPFYVFGLVGLWRLRRTQADAGLFLAVLLAYFVVLHLAVFAYFRYLVPIMPYVLLLAADGAVHAWQGARRRLGATSIAATFGSA
jgi:4-amino-4-deoxy-L-arabinose transferase-like glycosyltransferase